MNRISFKKWAFHFSVWVVIINIITFYNQINYSSLFNTYSVDRLLYLGILSTLLLLLTIIFIVISTIKKEKRNYQFWTALSCVFVFGVLPALVLMFGYHFVKY
ncbi:hypothetical protein AX016_0813 [Cellulophaga sp. RHA19]|uniref:hypothetical protein n=1 Tax=Cellulophaga sp. RHA19 TaxID=1798237 RepID=UPI000C2C7B51|nr:hypothetical protein [Cellulophaga sp. RHA19]PKB42645.1 hypothetical protein AX016_0813 [Cellulophaga sp. RHA19]